MKWLMALVFVLSGNIAVARAEGLSVPSNPKWQEECNSCHILYPPQLLTADNWKQLMGKLDKHFGSNASLDASDTKEILDFMLPHAGKGSLHSAASLRISDTKWFKREHREVAKRAWTLPEVKSRSNCSACHIKAEQGDWSERGIKMPGGLRRADDDD